MTPDEIQKETAHLNLSKFTAREIALWIYKRGANSFEEMTNISMHGRKLLSEDFTIGKISYSHVSISKDGTKKYVFPTAQNKQIETAYIPEKKRHTLCISSQVGCKLGCQFCMTGKQGFQGQLDTAEILNQILSIPEKENITNLVFMGMGEPFDNIDPVFKALTIISSDYGLEISPKKITISTAGLIPGIKKLFKESRCNLAVSLHSPFAEEREMLMPIEKKYPIVKVIETLKTYHLDKQRSLSFEYILFKDFNDTQKHVNQIARMLNGLRCKINLIRFHKIPDSPLEGTDDIAVQRFRDRLNKKGIIATVRASRGEDIMAACGLLSTKHFSK